MICTITRALPQQEQAADNENQVPAGDLLPDNREERPGQPDHPCYRKEQRDAHQHRGEQAEPACPPMLMTRQLSGRDRDEDDVVHAQNNFERRQCSKCNPVFRIRQHKWVLDQSVDISDFASTGTGMQYTPLKNRGHFPTFCQSHRHDEWFFYTRQNKVKSPLFSD
jgi:hypothetical protein